MFPHNSKLPHFLVTVAIRITNFPRNSIMTLKITGVPQSVCTLRVREVLAEMDVTNFELYKPNMAAKEHKVSIRSKF